MLMKRLLARQLAGFVILLGLCFFSGCGNSPGQPDEATRRPGGFCRFQTSLTASDDMAKKKIDPGLLTGR
jgi:hypothetical protein